MEKTRIQVLLIEDNPADVILLREALDKDERTLFEVTAVERLASATDILKSQTFDIVLLDLNLPDSQGLETFIRVHLAMPSLPKIILSGLMDETLALQAVHAGAQDYLVKGSDGFSATARATRYAIERQKTQSALRDSEENFAKVFRSSPTALSITSTGPNVGKFIELNKAYANIVGYDRKELIGHLATEFNIDVASGERQELSNKMRTNGTVRNYETTIRNKSGEMKSVIVSLELINFNGETCVLSALLDITERKQAERNYQDIFEHSEEGIFQSTPEGRFVKVNPAMARIYGYDSPQEMIDSIADIAQHIYVEPADRQIFTDLLANEDSVVDFEMKNRRKDGTIIWTSTSARVVRDGNGKPLYYEGFLQDITERKQSEEDLRESQERYQDLFENSPVAIWEEDFSKVKAYFENLKTKGGTDLDVYLTQHKEIISECIELITIVDVNQAALKLYEATKKTELLRGLKNTVPNETLMRFKDELLAIANGELSFRSETSVQTLQGNLREVAINWEVVPGYEHDYSKVLVSLTDVTERKQADEKLRAQEKRFRALIENSLDNISLLAADGTLLWENPAANRSLGYEQDEFVGRNIFELMHPDDVGWANELFAQLVREPGSNQHGIFRLRHSDGSWRWNEAIAANMLEEPSVKAIVINYRDITGRRQTEIEIQQRNDDLGLINTINEAVVRGESSDTVINLLLNGIKRIFSSQGCGIYLLSPDGKSIVLQHYFLRPELVSQVERMIGGTIPLLRLPVKEGGYFQKILNSKQAILNDDPKEIQRWITELAEAPFLPPTVQRVVRRLVPQIYKLMNVQSTIEVPLILDDVVIGIMGVSSSGWFTKDDLLRIENISRQLTSAIQRQQADEKIRKSEEFLQSVQNSLSAHIAILDDKGVIVRVNSAWRKFAEQNGYAHSNYGIGSNYLDVCDSATGPDLAEAPAVAHAIREMLAGQRKDARIDYQCHSPSEKRWFVLRITRFHDGERSWLVLTHENITERIRAEESLKESSDKFLTLFEASPEAIMLIDPHGDWPIIDCNETACQMNGYTREELIGQSIDLLNPSPGGDEAGRLEYLENVRTAGILRFDDLQRRKDGTTFPIETSTSVIRVGGRELVLGIDRDITERKQAEQALRESEALYRKAIEVAGAVPYLESYSDNGTKIHYDFIGEGIRQITGYGPEEFNAKLWDSLVEEVRLIEELAGFSFEEGIQRVRDGEYPIWKCEHRIRARDGEIHWVFESAIELRDENGISYGSIGTYQDITERKQAEEAFRKSAEENRAIVNAVPDLLFRINQAGEIVDYHARDLSDIYVGPEAFIGKSVLDVLPANVGQQGLAAIAESRATGKTATFEYETALHGAPRFYENRVVPLSNQESLSIIRDITVRKQAQKSLQESEQRYRDLINQLPVVVYTDQVLDGIGHTQFVSPQVETILGFKEKEWIAGGLNLWRNQIHPEDRERVMEHYLDCVKNGEIFESEYRIRSKTGQILWLHDQFNTLYDAQGQPVSSHGIAYDITERKQTEAALSESERKFRSFIEQSSEGVILIDIDGKIIEWNPAQEQITGIPRTKALGAFSWNIQFQLLPPERRVESTLKSLKDSVLESLRTGRLSQSAHTSELTIETSQGVNKSLLQISYPIQTQEGYRLASIVRDDTERKHADEDIKRRVAELEALYENGLAISSLLDPKLISQKIVDILSEKLHWHHAAIRLYHAKTNQLEAVALNHPGLSEAQLQEEITHLNTMISDPNKGLTGWVIKQHLPLRTADLTDDPRYVETFPGMKSGLYVPVLAGEHVLGAISVESEAAAAFTEQDERLLMTLANQAAIAIENAKLYLMVQKQLDERLQAEESLRKSEEKYRFLSQELEIRVDERTAEVRDLYDNAPCGYHSLDGEGNILRINQTELHWLGYTREELIGHPFDEFITEESRILFAKNFLSFKQHGILKDFELDMLRKDGSTFPTLISATAIYDKEGKYLTSRSTLFDNTQRKHALETLRLANSEMKRAMRTKDEFLANMSHELRTPLNAILGLSESLLEQTAGPINEKQQRYLNTVNESGHHLLELINDILDLAKVEAGQIKLEPSKVNINNICQASLRIVKQLSQKKNQTVELLIEDESSHIFADERRLKQMIVNLLSNAVKFTPENGRLGLEVHVDQDEAKLLITVWDNGIGIPQEDLPRLFQPFVQLDSSLARESSGTGLGLALVAQMARLHGGSVNVTSQLGEGSRFTISLPWDPAITIDTLHKFKVSGKFPAVKLTSNKHTILLVEDTESVVMMVRDYLELTGYKVEVSRNGVDGVAKAMSIHPDLILMDVQMPGMDGLEATRRIRREDSLKRIPILALTALAMRDDRERCLAAGMNDYISKPVNLKVLVKTIQEYLSQLDAKGKS